MGGTLMLLLKSSHVMGNLKKGLSYKDEESFGHGNLVIISEYAPIVIFFSSFFAVKPFAEVLV